MKAIGIKTSLPIGAEKSFELFELEKPVAKGRDLLVKIVATSVNPVDYKIRENAAKNKTLELPKILGWDAVGRVEVVGENVQLFKVGDTIFYAGDITRSGTDAEFQLVDERIVGHAPTKLSIAETAAVPLTALTAWELLFDRLRISREKDKSKSVLIIGGAGGVGSMAIQLAKKIAGLTVLATASRKESADWCKKMGADFIVNHHDLLNEVRKAGFQQVDYILDFYDVNQYWDAFVELIKPQGSIGSISDPTEPVNLRQLKAKSVSFHWELMFTRSMFQTEDMMEQHHIFNQLADLLDKGILQSTLTTTYKGFTVENFKAAHALQESGKAIGKTVIEF